MTAQLELDKTFGSTVVSYGTIKVRVVVLKPKPIEEQGEASTEETTIADEDPILESDSSPLSGYLEKSKGKRCVVFLINGQCHDSWDNTFISRDLGFKYLRSRTMIIVDLDGLSNDAFAEIVQGSRQGLFPGKILNAISDRLVSTLKKDPDLMRLQTEAEQAITELQTGDEVVRHQLDELIDEHHAAASHLNVGDREGGARSSTQVLSFGKDKEQGVVVHAKPSVGDVGTPPVLVSNPLISSIRLRPDEAKKLELRSNPDNPVSEFENFEARVIPPIEGLTVSVKTSPNGRQIDFLYQAPSDLDDDEYPITTSFQAYAKYKGYEELRAFERDLVISLPGPRPPNVPPVLTVTPTFIRVASRQPIKLVSGGPSTHVRVRWDGEDSLALGAPPQWSFQAHCLTLSSYPSINFSQPKQGRFELLLDTPHGLLTNQELQFEVIAEGPEGRRLTALFVGRVIEPPVLPEPRLVTEEAPGPSAQRRPPYELRYIQEENWGSPTCWGELTWTKDEVGAFTEPTATAPLTLLINQDFEGLKKFREGLIKRQLTETVIQERQTRYSAHIAFHLYQMYRFKKAQTERQEASQDEVRVPQDADMRFEINRVAETLIRLMEVSR